MELLDLNDECLINLCRFFDAESIVAISETCKRLNNLAAGHFQHKRSYACWIGSVESEALAARTLRKVGQYLHRIDIMFELQYHSASYSELFTLLVESVRKHMREFSILGEICDMPLHILVPVFRRLHKLALQNLCWDSSCFAIIDLPSSCSNLRMLTVSGQIIFAPTTRKFFRNLECLDVDFSSEEEPAAILTQNPQLKNLNLWNRHIINPIQLNNFNTLLVNLQELYLDVRLIERPVEELPGLAVFPNLRSLKLYSIPASFINDILKIVETLVRLKDVVLQTNLTRLDVQFWSIQESLIRIATSLVQLQSFATPSIDWTPETVIDFVQRAQNLISFDFFSRSDTNFIITPTFIRELATIRKLSVGKRMQPLQLKMNSMYRGLKEVFTEPEVASFIQLS